MTTRNALQRKPLPLETAFVICCLVNLPGNLKELQMEGCLLFLLLRLEQKLAIKIHRSGVFSLEGWELNTAMCWEPACSQTKNVFPIRLLQLSGCCNKLLGDNVLWLFPCPAALFVMTRVEFQGDKDQFGFYVSAQHKIADKTLPIQFLPLCNLLWVLCAVFIQIWFLG